MSNEVPLSLSSDDSVPIIIERRSADTSRPTIAVLMDYMTQFVGSYEAQFRDAFHLKCRERDLNLLLVYGGKIDDAYFGSEASVGLFDLVRSSPIDGFVLMAPVIGSACSTARLRQFVTTFGSVPCCSVGVEIPGIPSIVVDNLSGMEAVVEHLICDHGVQRPLFLGGPVENSEAILRLEAYKRVLAHHDLPIDPTLITTGDFVSRGAHIAMEEALGSGLRFDAVIAANDTMALVAINVLLHHGFRVPRDVLVTGFDNLVAAGLGNPPLTTVAQPFDVMAESAIRALLDPREGRAVTPCLMLPTDLVIRRSCGCDRASQGHPSPAKTVAAQSAAEYLRQHDERLMSEIVTTMGTKIQNGERDAMVLLEGLRAEFDGRKGQFLKVVDEILEETGDDRRHCRALQNAITCLRENFRVLTSTEIEYLWYDARDRILATFMRNQTHESMGLEDSYWRLIEAGEQLSHTVDLDSLRKKLGTVLPHMRVSTAILSTCVDESPDRLTPFVCLVDGQAREALENQYSARVLFPPGTRPTTRQTMLVFPLDGKDQHVGLAIFGYNGQALGQQLLRNQIASALSNIRIYGELVEQNRRNERNIQERAATLKRLQSLSVLAGGVAHDLNNAIGPLVVLPDVILSEVEKAGVMDALPSFRDDIDTIKTSALRAAQTIKDLLTLGRQGRTKKNPLDIGKLITSALQAELLRFLGESNPQVRITLDVAEQPIAVCASEAHLMRAITNLVHNAVEAIRGPGHIVIKLQKVHLSKPLDGYESVDPGDYAVLSVSDSGDGIPEHDISRIFEPFFSRKSVSPQSGSGLGLAIVHGVVKEHDGFVDVASTVGAGTTFTLYFPCINSPTQASGEAAPAPRGQANLLVVDDDGVQLRTGMRVLRHMGYQVDVLDSGEKARASFVLAAANGKSPYDLVLMDMVLGEGPDGLAVIEEIQQLFPAQKAILLSGYAPTERVELAMRQGLIWLSKPYTGEALARAVHAALSDG
jgi:DNA-binding LacI/PurR family transcriptional regulator/signal transduction histidine kinase/ActR/RegA family two-component response regulator